jgi:hypothetical protein
MDSHVDGIKNMGVTMPPRTFCDVDGHVPK